MDQGPVTNRTLQKTPEKEDAKLLHRVSVFSP